MRASQKIQNLMHAFPSYLHRKNTYHITLKVSLLHFSLQSIHFCVDMWAPHPTFAFLPLQSEPPFFPCFIHSSHSSLLNAHTASLKPRSQSARCQAGRPGVLATASLQQYLLNKDRCLHGGTSSYCEGDRHFFIKRHF